MSNFLWPHGCCTPGFPVHHQLLEFSQTQVHRSMMPSSHLILWCPLLLLSPIPPSIRVFPNESTLCMRWPKYWSFSLSISPSNEHQDWSPLGWTGWISLRLNNIPLYGSIILCLFIYQLMDIWVVTTLGVLWIMLPWTFMYLFLHEYIFSFLLVIYQYI